MAIGDPLALTEDQRALRDTLHGFLADRLPLGPVQCGGQPGVQFGAVAGLGLQHGAQRGGRESVGRAPDRRTAGTPGRPRRPGRPVMGIGFGFGDVSAETARQLMADPRKVREALGDLG